MKPIMIIGIILIIVGVISFAYQGITYTKNSESVDLGPIEFDIKQKETIPLPPVIGGIALVGGIVLIAIAKK